MPVLDSSTSARPPQLAPLLTQLHGEIHTGEMMRRLYATDASEYQELPLAVVFPANEADVHQLVLFAHQHRIPLIPRAAGTSLAGQVVGHGVVVDLGRHLNQIIAIDPSQRRVRVQPGVVRFDLNHRLQREHAMFFSPETSTANRAMIGGMVGNNSCGANSVVYGSTREHLRSCRGFLSDGTEVTFGPLSAAEFEAKCALDSLEGEIYRTCRQLLGDAANRKLIREHFPKPNIPRRNTGYALDLLMDAAVFDPDASAKPFNLCQLIAGSEGTLFLGVEFELDCDPLPPSHSVVLCAHFESVPESLRAVGLALRQSPHAVELIDRHILDATKRNLEQRRNRFFVQGDPGAILVIDLKREDPDALEDAVQQLVAELKEAGLGYHFPILRGDDQNRVWELRRAGQGVMTNVPGDAKPREVVEDTAVDVTDLPAYIEEFDRLMREKHGIECVYYAHAGSGELHTRPLFNLKTPDGLRMYRQVAEDVAALVRKYRGSLSGEHGDGRLRGEFIPQMVGDQCFALMRRIKEAFDPHHIFNPGKIIDTPPMDTFLRHSPDQPHRDYETVFDFSETQGLLRAAEACNGSGDCRKSHLAGGAMCPSYMATRHEKDSTRARANALRHLLTIGPSAGHGRGMWANDDVKDVLDLCLSCKACKSECPANVDLAKLKAEFMQRYQDERGVPLRTRMIAEFATIQKLARLAPWAWNLLFGTPFTRRLLNRLAGFHPDRTIPLQPRQTFARWMRHHRPTPHPTKAHGTVWLFNDEFTNFTDPHLGIAAVELLEALGYTVQIPPLRESARSRLSKGLVREAKTVLNANIHALHEIVTAAQPLVGLEPSAILTFRDEAIDLAEPTLRDHALAIAPHCLTFEEFIVREMDAGRVTPESFSDEPRTVHLHGHCFQKALTGQEATVRALSLPRNYSVQMIPSGCCGMAGSFGYEKEHYEVSMQIGQLVLLPAVRAAAPDNLIAAPGTSCRHQIHDGTGRQALHPVEILRSALKQSRPER